MSVRIHYSKRLLAAIILLVSCLSLRAQEVSILDISNFNYYRTGDEKKEKLVFLQSFMEGRKGEELLTRYAILTDEMFWKKSLSYDPDIVLENLKKYAIGRRSWADVDVLEDGWIAVSDGEKSWGVMTVDGKFTIPLGNISGICSINRENKLMAVWNRNSDCGMMTFDGKAISDFKYDNIQTWHDGFALAQFGDTGDMVLLTPEDGTVYKEVSEIYYDIDTYSFEGADGRRYTILTVRDGNKTTGAIDIHGNVIIPLKYMSAAVADGRDFGRPERVFMYWRGLRKENGKLVVDYYYAPSLKLVYTGDYE